ncbi:hypothetical protein SISNIDRAFT_480909 [Sistotremastrum niveocremeum HHB9708]|uniref:Uncharacterized protein n=1 Tax=Sistotremastrum niveocremeum HHB9708 TaxID=1314777 RepID=A0A164ZVJ4_9AGAM|nr:hypothetical protein SISNIDRAFT_480909 [Sistotremastrum niveocremeum HHB9708]
MPPSVCRINIWCFTIIIPVRITLCLPLLILALEAFPVQPSSFSVDPQTQQPSLMPPHVHPAQALLLAFSSLAIAMSIIGFIMSCAMSKEGEPHSSEGEARWSLYIGTLSRVILAILGTAASVVAVVEKHEMIKHMETTIALSFVVTIMMYGGVFYRVYILASGKDDSDRPMPRPEPPRVRVQEVLRDGTVIDVDHEKESNPSPDPSHSV